MGAHFTLFDSPIGPCGLVWGEHGILAVFLPERSAAATRAGLLRRFPDARQTAPSGSIGDACDAIVALLNGESRNLAEIALDMRQQPELHARVYKMARTIEPGATLTYGEIAIALGSARLAQAVGQALWQESLSDHRAVPSCPRLGRQDRRLLGADRHRAEAQAVGDRERTCAGRAVAVRFAAAGELEAVMKAAQIFSSSEISVFEYRCSRGPGDRGAPEVHRAFSLSYVRKGSFGCRTRGRTFEFVAGSIMVGYPGDEYTCSHEHHACGDECLSFQFAPDLVEELGGTKAWRVGAVPPIASLTVVAELAQAAADALSDISIDEAGIVLAARFASSSFEGKTGEVAARDRRRAVEAGLWINEHAHEPIDLACLSQLSGLSAFHFLRLFAKTIGVTPHQYLIRCRLRNAARLLAADDRAITDVAFKSGFNDLSNFIRTFRRAARISPRAFRRMTKADRNKVQDRLGAFA